MPKNGMSAAAAQRCPTKIPSAVCRVAKRAPRSGGSVKFPSSPPKSLCSVNPMASNKGGNVQVKFVGHDAIGLPVKRKQVHQACTPCRKRKVRQNTPKKNVWCADICSQSRASEALPVLKLTGPFARNAANTLWATRESPQQTPRRSTPRP